MASGAGEDVVGAGFRGREAVAESGAADVPGCECGEGEGGEEAWEEGC